MAGRPPHPNTLPLASALYHRWNCENCTIFSGHSKASLNVHVKYKATDAIEKHKLFHCLFCPPNAPSSACDVETMKHHLATVHMFFLNHVGGLIKAFANGFRYRHEVPLDHPYMRFVDVGVFAQNATQVLMPAIQQALLHPSQRPTTTRINLPFTNTPRATQVPMTQAPTMQAPAALAPSIQGPTTQAATAQASTIRVATTQAPTTQVPTTLASASAPAPTAPHTSAASPAVGGGYYFTCSGCNTPRKYPEHRSEGQGFCIYCVDLFHRALPNDQKILHEQKYCVIGKHTTGRRAFMYGRKGVEVYNGCFLHPAPYAAVDPSRVQATGGVDMNALGGDGDGDGVGVGGATPAAGTEFSRATQHFSDADTNEAAITSPQRGSDRERSDLKIIDQTSKYAKSPIVTRSEPDAISTSISVVQSKTGHNPSTTKARMPRPQTRLPVKKRQVVFAGPDEPAALPMILPEAQMMRPESSSTLKRKSGSIEEMEGMPPKQVKKAKRAEEAVTVEVNNSGDLNDGSAANTQPPPSPSQPFIPAEDFTLYPSSEPDDNNKEMSEAAAASPSQSKYDRVSSATPASLSELPMNTAGTRIPSPDSADDETGVGWYPPAAEIEWSDDYEPFDWNSA